MAEDPVLLAEREHLDLARRCLDSMRESAVSMSSAAEQTTQQSGIVANASEQATANVQTVAAATEELAASIRILYGGSVKPDNTTSLCTLEDIDGALVGGASLDPNSFSQIVANSATK